MHIAHGTWPVRTPRILGHELAGTIAKIGPGGDTGAGGARLAVGMRVTTETDASFCGACRFCRAGDMHLCAQRTGIGTSADGGFAELVAIPAGGVHKLPDGLDLEAGALIEPLAVAVRAVVERGAVHPGERVAVVGPGSVGLLAAQVALAVGAEVTLAGLARHVDRFRLARELGVTSALVLDDDDARRFAADSMDVVLECSGSPAALGQALALARKGGRIILVGFHGERVPMDVDLVINRELTLAASRGKRPTSFSYAVELVAGGRVDPGRLITHRFRLEDWPEAFAAAEGSSAKVVMRI